MRNIEQVFIDFYTLAMSNGIPLQGIDRSPARSFYNLCLHQKQVTQKQAKFMLRLLDKYKSFALTNGLDYEQELKDPQWDKPFRVIDDSKEIFVEFDEDNMPWLCFKFPYGIINEFEKKILNSTYTNLFDDVSIYDKDRKIRMIPVHDLNLVHVNEFATAHSFKTDTLFQDLLSYTEEIWNNIESYVPYSEIENNRVRLHNGPESAENIFKSTDNTDHAMFQAKTMGYPLWAFSTDKFTKICSSEANTFWTSNWKTLFEVGKRTPGLVVIVLSKDDDYEESLQHILYHADEENISRDNIKVCFRKDSKTNKGFNDWLADQGVTGPVDNSKYLIFHAKPAKWLFTNNNDVSIISTNTVYVHSNSLTKNWFESHPCAVYVTETPISHKGKQIVNL